MHQSGVHVHPDVGLHPEVPLVAFLGQVFENEGGVRTTGYQPSKTSGVTIGAGVDLSQWNTVQALENAGVSSTVANYLKTWMVSASQVQSTVDAHGWPQLSATDALNLSKDIYNTIYT
ncbi:MAG: pesticin C-terminus-like muramidase [Ktedonobacteraceae bacterium]